MASRIVRDFRPGDEAGLRALFETTHGRAMSESVWHWRFERNPFGRAVTTVAESDGKIIGHLAALPARMLRGEETARAGLWMDLMVDPRFDDNGLFPRMAEANLAACRDANLSLLYSFSDEKGRARLKTLPEWQTVSEINSLETPLSQVRGPHPASRWSVKFAMPSDGELTDFWSNSRPPASLCLLREAPWVRWRYSRPDIAYETYAVYGPDKALDGWLTTRTFQGERGLVGDILDLWVRHWTPAADTLLHYAVADFESKGVDIVSAWALPHTETYKYFESVGLSPGQDRTYFSGRPVAPDAAVDFPLNPELWFVSKGDSDAF